MNWKRVREIIVCFIAIIALMAAGSDGDFFPVPNIVGLLILAALAFVAAYSEESAAYRKWKRRNSSNQNLNVGMGRGDNHDCQPQGVESRS